MPEGDFVAYDDGNRTYTLTSSSTHSFYTGTNDSQQLLLGLQFPCITVVTFNREGELLGYNQRELPEQVRLAQDWEHSITLRAEIEGFIDNIKQEVGFAESPIVIRSFFIPELRSGIRPLPDEYMEVMSHPDRTLKEQYDFIAGEIERWKQEGQFVFYWNKDYWVDRLGAVVSS